MCVSPKYLRDTEDTALHIFVSVSKIHFKSIFPTSGNRYVVPAFRELQWNSRWFLSPEHTRKESRVRTDFYESFIIHACIWIEI